MPGDGGGGVAHDVEVVSLRLGVDRQSDGVDQAGVVGAATDHRAQVAGVLAAQAGMKGAGAG